MVEVLALAGNCFDFICTETGKSLGEVLDIIARHRGEIEFADKPLN